MTRYCGSAPWASASICVSLKPSAARPFGMPVACISSMMRAASTSPASSWRRAADRRAERTRATQMALRMRGRRVAPYRRIVEHDRHAVRDQRLAGRIAVDVPVLDQARHGVRQSMRQVAAGGVERDAREHRRVHHLGARFGVGCIVDRAHQVLADALQRLRRRAHRKTGSRPATPDAAALRRIEPARIERGR